MREAPTSCRPRADFAQAAGPSPASRRPPTAQPLRDISDKDAALGNARARPVSGGVLRPAKAAEAQSQPIERTRSGSSPALVTAAPAEEGATLPHEAELRLTDRFRKLANRKKSKNRWLYGKKSFEAVCWLLCNIHNDIHILTASCPSSNSQEPHEAKGEC